VLNTVKLIILTDIMDDISGGAQDLLDQLTGQAEKWYEDAFPCTGFSDAKECAYLIL